MRWILIAEQIAQMAAALLLINITSVELAWWIWLVLFFAPDLGFVGYAVNTKVGAVTYNLLHHKGLALVIISWGFFQGDDRLLAAGLLLYAHSSFDRIFGYGLKYADDFKHTHLGWLK